MFQPRHSYHESLPFEFRGAVSKAPALSFSAGRTTTGPLSCHPGLTFLMANPDARTKTHQLPGFDLLHKPRWVCDRACAPWDAWHSVVTRLGWTDQQTTVI